MGILTEAESAMLSLEAADEYAVCAFSLNICTADESFISDDQQIKQFEMHYLHFRDASLSTPHKLEMKALPSFL